MPAKTTTKKKTTSKARGNAKKGTIKRRGSAWPKDDKESLEALEFIQAIDRYKRRTQKSFPTWSEVLEILKGLGYSKVK